MRFGPYIASTIATGAILGAIAFTAKPVVNYFSPPDAKREIQIADMEKHSADVMRYVSLREAQGGEATNRDIAFGGAGLAVGGVAGLAYGLLRKRRTTEE